MLEHKYFNLVNFTVIYFFPSLHCIFTTNRSLSLLWEVTVNKTCSHGLLHVTTHGDFFFLRWPHVSVKSSRLCAELNVLQDFLSSTDQSTLVSAAGLASVYLIMRISIWLRKK